jgi:protein-arginine kinase activator protein McsA
MWNFANNLKNVLTVTLKDELDDIILHYVKELKETENKLKETENKLKELNDKLKESINNTQFYESLLTKQNDKLKELYDKQKNMIIVGEEC